GTTIRLRPGEPAPNRHGSGGEDREHHELDLPGYRYSERDQPDQQRGEPEPEQENARRQHLQCHQDEADDQPVPGAERYEHVGHDTTSLILSMPLSENRCPLFRGMSFTPAAAAPRAACSRSSAPSRDERRQRRMPHSRRTWLSQSRR